MQILSLISDVMVPFLFFYILGYALFAKVKVYEVFLKGAGSGLKVVVEIAPTLVGLLVAVGVLRASGFLDFVGRLAAPLVRMFDVPGEILPVLFFKLFSGSAATGLVLDLFRTHGPDSYIGVMASILVSCTETCFYTMSVFFLAAKVTKTRYTLPGALTAIGAGTVAAVILTKLLFNQLLF